MADDDPSFVPNKVSGRVVTTQAAANPPRLLTKKDCKKILTDVKEAEKAMGWIQWFATKDDAWRNPWVIDARYQQCKRLPAQIEESRYLEARDKLIAYDRGELQMSGEDAIKLRGEVNLVQDRYDGIGIPYKTMPADYMSEAEKEVFRRTGNNLGMAVVPTSIPGVMLTRAFGGNETQAGQMGEASAGVLGAAGAMYSAKVGGPALSPTPLREEQIPARSSAVNTAPKPRRQSTPVITEARDGTLVIRPRMTVLNPKNVRLSQNTVSYKKTDRETGEKYTYDDLVKSMKEKGWSGDPVDVVKMPDGQLTSMDNTRITAAREAGVNVEAVVRNFDEPLTRGMQEARGWENYSTWGDAISGRIQSQSGGFGSTYPYGSPEVPNIKGRPK